MTAPLTTAAQPISRVAWVDRLQLDANDYNPNHVAPIELRLLRLSILTDGWVAPLSALPVDPVTRKRQLVDGFHRWGLSADPEVWRLTDGLVPVVTLDLNEAARQAATIRANRARGTHHVLPMADIVADLLARGWAPDYVAQQLGMDQDEVRRLADRGRMTERGAAPALSEAWKPAPR